MVIFYCLLNIGELYSFIVFKENTQTPRMKRRLFIRNLAKELCKGYMASRVAILSTPTNTKKRLREIFDLQDIPVQDALADEITSGRCRVCDWKKNRLSKTRCVACRQFICREHTAPVMCVNCTNNKDEVMDLE
uniref:PiggyBac transposable element-derived protein 4 C-terminal zinc-ribbon domain-containing protein n=1 Tax=Clastoptera arizonana TaxID=38151 RepID=A0A1B6CK00_9HEMI